MTQPDNQLTVEVLLLFFPAFEKAVKECTVRHADMKIVKKEPAKLNSLYVTVETENPKHFFYLGKYYCIHQSEI